MKAIRIPVDEMTSWATAMFAETGLSPNDAATAAWAVVTPSVRGVHSHGVMRIPQYVENLLSGKVNAKASMKWVVEAGAIAVLDADNGMGHIAATRAVEESIRLAKEHGISAVGVRNSTHLGAPGTYTLLAPPQDCITQLHTNGPVVMPPTGAAEARVSTNPVATAIPANERSPITLDVSMAIAAGGKISIAQLEGREIPDGWALDIEGNPTRDPVAARQGMLLPIGDHKGYGMALISDALSGVLTGSLFGTDVRLQGVASLAMKVDDRPADRIGIGHFCFTVDIAHFMDVETFKKRVDELIDQVHAAKRRPGVARIFVPGELEFEAEKDSRANGIPISEPILNAVTRVSAELGVPTPIDG